MASSSSRSVGSGERGATAPAVLASDDPDPRKRLAAALQLLSAYEGRNPAVDARDAERSRALTPALARTAPGPLGRPAPTAISERPSEAGPTGPGGGRGDQRLRELQRRLHVADAVTKKLHHKNKVLQEEIDALRAQVAAGGVVPAGSANGAGAMELVAHRQELQGRDERIRQLEARVAELEGRQRADGRGPTAATAGPADPVVRRLQADLEATRENLRNLEQQYHDLVDIKIDSMLDGTVSTSQINKEVKVFFATLRKKLHDECAAREAERAAMTEQLCRLETELMEKQCKDCGNQTGAR